MPLTIELTPEQESRLKAAARATGTNEKAVLDSLIESLPAGTASVTWGERMISQMQAEGVLCGYGDPTVDSPELARRLRDNLAGKLFPKQERSDEAN